MTETISFNLLDEPWIPCLDANGVAQEYSLRDTVARASALQEIYAESPLVTASLYRLCLAVLHSALRGPKDWRAWGKLWDAGAFDMAWLNKYFDEWRERFDLFGKHPFYQALDGELNEHKPVSAMVIGIAGGNNPTLFDHHTDEDGFSLTPAQAARALVTIQGFALGGGKNAMPENFTDGSCARGIVFLAEGDNLFETLMLNLIKYPTDDNVFITDEKRDKPAWEIDKPFKRTTLKPLGYLDYLTWHSRRARLAPELTPNGRLVIRWLPWWAQGNKLPDGVFDLMKCYRKNEKATGKQDPFPPLRFMTNRAIWRDSASLFQINDQSAKPPFVCQWLANLVGDGYLQRSFNRRLMAFGVAAEKADMVFYRAEHLPLPLNFLGSTQRIGKLTLALTLAEQSGGALIGAVKLLAGELTAANNAKKESSKPSDKKGKRKQESDGDGGKERKARDQLAASWNVGARYWGTLETPFWVLMDKLAYGGNDDAWDAALFEWRDKVRDAIRRAFALAEESAGTNPRALKAAVLARTQLRMSLGRIMPKQENGKEKEV